MSRRGVGLVAWSLCALGPRPVLADFAWYVPVVQPVESEGGLIPCVTTYSTYFAPEDKSRAALLLTLSPNAIVMSSGEPVDANAAVGEHLLMAATQRADTLFVKVDATKVALPVVAAMTLWCGLRNAKYDWPHTKFVKYDILGSPQLQKYSGVYSLELVAPALASSEWQFDKFAPSEQSKR